MSATILRGKGARQWRRLLLLALLTLCPYARGTAAQAPAQRIISTAPSITEALFAMGFGAKVVGVSQYCEWPEEVKRLPRVGGYSTPNVEAITRLRPDLVILESASNELGNRLRAVGIRYVEVPHGSLADTYAGMEVIARAAGAPERGSALVARLREQLAALKAKADRSPRVRVLLAIDRQPGTLTDIYAVGPGGFINDLLELTGGVNVLARAGVPAYPKISLETVLREDPEVLIDLSDSHDTDDANVRARARDKAMWERERALQAARNGRIVMGDTTMFLVPGPRLVDAAAKLYDYMHAGSR